MAYLSTMFSQCIDCFAYMCCLKWMHNNNEWMHNNMKWMYSNIKWTYHLLLKFSMSYVSMTTDLRSSIFYLPVNQSMITSHDWIQGLYNTTNLFNKNSLTRFDCWQSSASLLSNFITIFISSETSSDIVNNTPWTEIAFYEFPNK